MSNYVISWIGKNTKKILIFCFDFPSSNANLVNTFASFSLSRREIYLDWWWIWLYEPVVGLRLELAGVDKVRVLPIRYRWRLIYEHSVFGSFGRWSDSTGKCWQWRPFKGDISLMLFPQTFYFAWIVCTFYDRERTKPLLATSALWEEIYPKMSTVNCSSCGRTSNLRRYCTQSSNVRAAMEPVPATLLWPNEVQQ